VFTAGQYTLSSENIPLLNKIINPTQKDNSSFAAEIWYINKDSLLEVKWGTPTPIQVYDPKYNVPLPLRAFGQFDVQIYESKHFLNKLIGMIEMFDKNSLVMFFRNLYLSKFKDFITLYLEKMGISVMELNDSIPEVSEHLKKQAESALSEYGLTLLNFSVNKITVPADDPAVKKLDEALAKESVLEIVEQNYVQEAAFEKTAATVSTPEPIQPKITETEIKPESASTPSVNVREMKKCPGCNADMDAIARFCSGCGQDTQTTKSEEAELAKSAEPLVKVCGDCRFQVGITQKFCHKCGHKF
jgi:membrane protease subunit (stomatin/prohibitin family)